jgi:hypothetical protein
MVQQAQVAHRFQEVFVRDSASKTSFWATRVGSNQERQGKDLQVRRRRGFWAGYASVAVSKNLKPVSDRNLSQLWGVVKTRQIDKTSLLPSSGLLGLCSQISLSLHRVKC